MNSLTKYILIAIWFTLGCKNQKTDHERSSQAIAYFDLEQYFASDLLDNCSDEFMNLIRFNNTTDSGVISKDQIITDLAFLDRFNINSSSHYGDYNVDTVLENQMVAISYDAKKESSALRYLHILKDNEGVIHMSLNVRQTSLLRKEILNLDVNYCALTLTRETTSLFGKSEIIRLEFRPMLE